MAKKTLIPYSVRRELAPGALVHSNLSGAAFTDDWLWVAGDEACAVDRLRKLGPVQRQTLRFGEGRAFRWLTCSIFRAKMARKPTWKAWACRTDFYGSSAPTAARARTPSLAATMPKTPNA